MRFTDFFPLTFLVHFQFLIFYQPNNEFTYPIVIETSLTQFLHVQKESRIEWNSQQEKKRRRLLLLTNYSILISILAPNKQREREREREKSSHTLSPLYKYKRFVPFVFQLRFVLSSQFLLRLASLRYSKSAAPSDPCNGLLRD